MREDYFRTRSVLFYNFARKNRAKNEYIHLLSIPQSCMLSDRDYHASCRKNILRISAQRDCYRYTSANLYENDRILLMRKDSKKRILHVEGN